MTTTGCDELVQILSTKMTSVQLGPGLPDLEQAVTFEAKLSRNSDMALTDSPVMRLHLSFSDKIENERRIDRVGDWLIFGRAHHQEDGSVCVSGYALRCAESSDKEYAFKRRTMGAILNEVTDVVKDVLVLSNEMAVKLPTTVMAHCLAQYMLTTN